MDDAEGDGGSAQQDTQKIHESRPDDGGPGFERLGIDDRRHRVRRVMEPVHKFKAERDREAEK